MPVTATQGIVVGNSAAATTPGSVVKKMEVFDAAGVSLGFVPILQHYHIADVLLNSFPPMTLGTLPKKPPRFALDRLA